MSEMDEVVQEFLVESHENLDQLDRDLLALEQNPNATGLLAGVFRTIHTIKGTCGFLGFSKLESVTHVGETLLTRLRDGELVMNPTITSALLALVDAVREMLRAIEDVGSEGDGDYANLVDLLSRLATDAPVDEIVTPDAPPVAADPVVAQPVAADPVVAEPVAVEPVVVATPDPGPPADPPKIGELLVATGRVTPEAVEAAIEQQALGDPRHIGEILVEHGSLAPHEVVEVLQEQGEARPSVSDNTIRVDVALLDKLMNLVGELVLARNQILQFTSTQNDAAFLGTSQRLNLITTELQERVMKTRMQPIGNIWNKLPRVVRDLALGCGKQVHIEMDGNDTELDKTILEAIKDPLTHLVRNSVDHGIELPEVRRAAGKPAEGRLGLRAFHEGGQVIIEIFDDGAGIQPDRLRNRAVERGLIAADQAARMSDGEAMHLIFLPGFSTAEKVTNVSGRGVGMDVVKTNVERIGGTVDVQSRPGEGTNFRIKIPLTLAIIPALTVTTGGDRYAIPQVSLLELVRIEGDEAATAIEMVHGAPVYRLRGKLLPLVRLAEQLQVEPEPSEAINIVVLQADDQQFGLVVDSVNDTEEIVVKPLGRQLKHLSAFAGATIMGDGRVALILDVLGIARRAGVVSEVRSALLADAMRTSGDGEADHETLLVLGVGHGRYAVPLGTIARLEEFTVDAIEHASGRQVVQYRGGIMPLISLADVLGQDRRRDDELLQVVVCTHGGKPVGFVVDQILDIVDEALQLEPSGKPGIRGTAVVQQRVTDVLDLPTVVAIALPDLAAALTTSDLLTAGV